MIGPISHIVLSLEKDGLILPYIGEHTVRLLVPGHFYFYAVSKFSLRENDISVLLLKSIITPLNNESQFV